MEDDEPGGAAEPSEGAARTPSRVAGTLPRLLDLLRTPLPWSGTRPSRAFLASCLAVVGGILLVKVVLESPVRLQVYVIEVGVIFLLGFVVLEGARLRDLASRATRADLGVALAGVAGMVLWNVRIAQAAGLRVSPEPGFGDAIALILLLFVALYGLRSVRAMVAPISLLVILAGITVFISNEDPTFYALVGRYFVAFTVALGAALLSTLGYSVVADADSFRILGTPSLTVEVGVRCGGLDVAAIYALLILYFIWQTQFRPLAKVLIAVGAAAGALLLNGLRVVLLTVLFMQYPPDLVEAVHTNVGDFLFLGYAVAFIVVLRRAM